MLIKDVGGTLYTLVHFYESDDPSILQYRRHFIHRSKLTPLKTVHCQLPYFMMLSSLVKEHHAKQSANKERQELKRKEAITAANNLTQALVDHLNVGVAQAYLNQKRLDAEAKQLHNNATNFAKQTQQWLNLVENFNSALKEIGDAENWARSIESDMQTISSALDYAYKATQETPAPLPSQSQ